MKMAKVDHSIDIEKIQKIIDYKFNNNQLIFLALSHSSYVNEKKSSNVSSYERLEFLGDAVVNIIVSEYLYENYPKLTEGELTRIRAIVVCEPTFSKCIKKLGISEHLLLGKGEELTGGRERISILADLFETVTGAIFLDGGIEPARKFALEQLNKVILDAVSGTVFMDYKTQLQEILQKNSDTKIIYSITNQSGPDHDKVFLVNVMNKGEVLGGGTGKSKKEAEQHAAKDALRKLNSIL